MHDLAPVIVNLRRDNAPETLLAALSATRPLVLVAGLGTEEPLEWGACPRALLRHPMPVTGVLHGRLDGPAAGLMLACDTLYVTTRSSLRFAASERGEARKPELEDRARLSCLPSVWVTGAPAGSGSREASFRRAKP